MPKMMLELIEAILASRPDLQIAGQVPADSDLCAATRRHRADVLIVMQHDGGVSKSDVDRMFWRRPSKVFAIAEGGRAGVLYVLHPHSTQFSDLSVDNLIDAISSPGQS
jgi:hypothetical protein